MFMLRNYKLTSTVIFELSISSSSNKPTPFVSCCCCFREAPTKPNAEPTQRSQHLIQGVDCIRQKFWIKSSLFGENTLFITVFLFLEVFICQTLLNSIVLC
ncbi:hypothetical protein MtrunA17_Chr5g0444741 [Medicago truncatula]|uniref:Transmembrane protein n=1 Tax=Medicago truncatula TaxID=3880 RepID=A0A396HX02_MEDTR|nr:hypothetical protein MtrunA17_Chr5g0444741 [Medicago truncatula]